VLGRYIFCFSTHGAVEYDLRDARTRAVQFGVPAASRRCGSWARRDSKPLAGPSPLRFRSSKKMVTVTISAAVALSLKFFPVEAFCYKEYKKYSLKL
jgi:hypothetical protein